MFCKKCGTELSENGTCSNCGFVYEPMHSNYMQTNFEKGRTLELPPLEEFVEQEVTENPEIAEEQYTVEQPQEVHEQYSPQKQEEYVQAPQYGYYAQPNFYQQETTVYKKSMFSWRSWFVPVTFLIHVVFSIVISVIHEPIVNDIYMDAVRANYNDAYLSSIYYIYNILTTIVEVIILFLVGFVLYHIAFIKVEKKNKRPCFILVFLPFFAVKLWDYLYSICTRLTTMWYNNNMIELHVKPLIDGAYSLICIVIVFICLFAISKSFLGKIEDSWRIKKLP